MTKISGWARPNVDARIAAHVHAWEKSKAAGPRPVEKFPFITIARPFGCDALPLAHRLAEVFTERFRPTYPWVAYDREVLDKVATELHLHREVVESLDGHRRDAMRELFDTMLNRHVDEALMFRKMAEVIRSLAVHGNAVLVGRGSYLITQDLKMGLHVRLEAPREWRILHAVADFKISPAEAEQLVDQRQKERQKFLQTFFVHDPARPFHHDLVIDVSRFGPLQAAEIIFTALTVRFGEKLAAS